MVSWTLFWLMDTIYISYFLLTPLNGCDLHIGVNFVRIQNANQVYYYYFLVFYMSF